VCRGVVVLRADIKWSLSTTIVVWFYYDLPYSGFWSKNETMFGFEKDARTKILWVLEASIFFPLSTAHAYHRNLIVFYFQRTRLIANDSLRILKTDLNLSWSLIENEFFPFSILSPTFLHSYIEFKKKNEFRISEKLETEKYEKCWKSFSRLHWKSKSVFGIFVASLDPYRYVGNRKYLNSCFVCNRKRKKSTFPIPLTNRL